ncbi:unnamed protein product [Hydatigera taeniaeformis]|uniref:WW domain-containing protein n=1 Tax=Hydatigena taeniaeformis TaxID=6205 RepID=A0A158RD78_HYDTA|nr:unnamed protein product [Hydatigera taeniaeformis]
MSRTSPRPKQYSRQYDITNGNSNSVAKSIHRYAQENDSYRNYRHRSRHSQERIKSIYGNRKTPKEVYPNSRHRSRRSSGNGSPDCLVRKSSRRDSNNQHRHSYSKSPRNRHRRVNKRSSKAKERSSLSSSSRSLRSIMEPKVSGRVTISAESPESFIPFLVASPISPNPSFGNSLFDQNSDQPKNPISIPPDEVYTPEDLHLLLIPASSSAVLPLVAGQKTVAELDDAGVIRTGVRLHEGGKEEDEEVVPMDLASSPFPHRSLEPNKGPIHQPSTPPPQNEPPVEPKKRNSFTDESSMTGPSAGIEVSKATKAHNERMRSKLVPAKRITLPPLHLHLSEDGTSPLPPGWQRAPNPAAAQGGEDGGYPYYYYHTKTRITRWDPPVYPWDADPEDNLIPDRPDDDPEAPYNWNCAHRYAVTHEEIELMYAQYRSRMLERQCMELIHEMGARPDVPQGAQEQSFAIELFSFIHNELRKFRDARVDLGRITSDEDLHHLTNKLAQEVIPKEIRNLHRAQQASASSLFAAVVPEVTPGIRERVSSYVRRYMESKGLCCRRSVLHHHSHQHHYGH